MFNYSNLISRIKLLLRSIKLIKNSDPKLFFLLCFVVTTSTTLPVLAIKSSADIINNLATKAYGTKLYSSLIFWALVLFVHDLISPTIFFLQSNLGDKAVFFINTSIITKSHSLIGIEHFEDSQFYNDLQIISSNAYNKPINLVITVIGLFKDICLITYCMSLLFINISFTSLIILACIILQTKISTKIQSDMWLESLGRSSRSRMMNYISNIFTNQSYSKEVRLFPIGKYLFEKYTSLFKEIYCSMFKLRLKLFIWPILPSIILLLGNIYALYETMELITNNLLGIGAIAVIIQCFMQLHTAVLSFGEQSGWLSGHLLFFEKYFNFIVRTENDFFLNKNLFIINKDFQIKNIKFENVSFEYPDKRMALRNINFEITRMDKLAIVGQNGSGKTTLVKLICGLCKPTSGQILINNIPIENYDLTKFRDYIAPVFQDFGSYALSINENIVMGAELNSTKLEHVINEVGANFAYDLPGKLENQLGKMFGGTDLSIGQWQKLAIARALYKEKSELFILDEPTSSLDPVSEHEIFEYFSKICSNKMTIFVTHRLTTIGLSNKILLLDNGIQVAFDAHENLMYSCNLYKKMFNSQASKFLSLI